LTDEQGVIVSSVIHKLAVIMRKDFVLWRVKKNESLPLCPGVNRRSDYWEPSRRTEEWIKRRGWEIVTIYRENETAWKAGHQKRMARLKADARMRILMRGSLGAGPCNAPGCLLPLPANSGTSKLDWSWYPWGSVARIDRRTYRRICRAHWIYCLLWKASGALIGQSRMDRARAEGKHIGRPKGKKIRCHGKELAIRSEEQKKEGIMTAKLANYTTTISANKTVMDIQRMLQEHGQLRYW